MKQQKLYCQQCLLEIFFSFVFRLTMVGECKLSIKSLAQESCPVVLLPLYKQMTLQSLHEWGGVLSILSSALRFVILIMNKAALLGPMMPKEIVVQYYLVKKRGCRPNKRCFQSCH